METEELYQDLLNLAAPWCVKAVLVEDGAIKVLVRLEGTEATLHACPRCGYRCMPCDHTKEKTWRHLDTCGKQTFIQARLPVAECPEHGRQPITPPFADADLPVTLALARTVNRIVRDSGSLKRTALIVGLDEDLVRSILRNSPQLAGVWKGPARDSRPCPTAASVPDPTRQLSLFSQDDMILMNQALHAFKSLQLEQAVELFQKYRKTFPRGHDVAAKTALAEFLLKGLQEAPNDLAERVPYLCRLWDRFEDCVQSNSMNPHDRLISEQKKAFFRGMLKEIEQTSPACTVSIIGGIPLGYLFLEAEQHEQAIPHLQLTITHTCPHGRGIWGRVEKMH